MNTQTKHIRQHALETCKNNNAQLTPLREMVLDLLLEYQGVVKAYQLLDDIRNIKKNAAPPTVYRALDFWVDQGIVHKVQALNGYILCQQHENTCEQTAILLCEDCQHIFETSHNQKIKELEAELAQQGFKTNMEHLVFTGTCQRCQNKK